jgi:Tol biopolymer transport system component
MRADGSHERRLTHSGEQVAELGGSFSPDGETFLFNRAAFDESGEPDKSASGLFVMDADGSEERRLVADGGEPAFSPDGRLIAFVTARDRNGELSYGEQVTPAGELYVMRADGTHPRRLTRTRDLNEANPSWLPDGKRLAYQRGRVISNAEGMVVMQVNPDGSCARPLLADPRLDTWYNNPAWRPGIARHDAGRLRCRAR